MNTTAYTSMKEEMKKGTYTEVSAKETINNLYIRQAMTKEEYNELMDLANGLSVNTEDGKFEIRIVTLEKDVEDLKEEIQAIKDAMSSEGTDVPEPDAGPTGETDDPIMAYRGMTYYKDKYYRDSEDNQVYKCFRDNDTEPGSGIALAYLPHELVNIYFYFDRVS